MIHTIKFETINTHLTAITVLIVLAIKNTAPIICLI